MFTLLLCMGWVLLRRNNLFGMLAAAFASKAGRTYNDTATDSVAALLAYIFRLGVLAMTAMTLLCQNGPFHFTLYLQLLLALLLADGLRLLCNVLINYTFDIDHQPALAYRHYANLMLMTAMLLYPITLAVIHWGISLAAWIMLAITAALFLIAFMIRLVRMYVQRPYRFAYVLIYILTIEVMPYAAIALAFTD